MTTGARSPAIFTNSMMQSLFAFDLSIGALKRSNSPETTLRAVAELETILAGAQREVRAISFLLHPPLLEEMGLRAALQGLVEGFQARTGVETALTFEGDLNFGWRAAEVAVYRMAQEALSNVHRHSRATAVAVGIVCRREMIHVTVVDNGTGIPLAVRNGVGLTGMRERFKELGGRLMVRSALPGTMLFASLPLPSRIKAVGDLAVHT